ncbi:MAG TPA: hypothetical protein PLG48_00770 [Candidatus Avimonas sp.]|nr:hypothetical protein [Candidatus Avimonas sp.]
MKKILAVFISLAAMILSFSGCSKDKVRLCNSLKSLLQDIVNYVEINGIRHDDGSYVVSSTGHNPGTVIHSLTVKAGLDQTPVNPRTGENVNIALLLVAVCLELILALAAGKFANVRK